ncbi:MAG: CZB domain-containing protein, partial [Giesbergeria sp.]|nr:CZB domain-containing protein [Giesbergeria sp.]
MGFFSRMFKLREQDSSSPETTWAYEDNASELILDPEYAATLMTEFDIDAAIASHEEWKQRLHNLLAGQSNEVLDPEQVGEYVHCPLGRWLQGEGRERLGHY